MAQSGVELDGAVQNAVEQAARPAQAVTHRPTLNRAPAEHQGTAVSHHAPQLAALDAAVQAAVDSAKAGPASAGLNAAVDQAIDHATQSVTQAAAASSTKAAAPAPEIERLDEALAQRTAAANAAGDEFEDVSVQLQTKATPAPTGVVAPTPVAAPAPAPAPAPSATPVAPAKPAAGPTALPATSSTPTPQAPTPVAPTAPQAAKTAPAAAATAPKVEAAAEPKPGSPMLARLLHAIEPLALRLGKIAPAKRQTIGWVALMTAFNALWVWGFVLLKSPSTISYEGDGHAALTGKPIPSEEQARKDREAARAKEPPPAEHGEGGGHEEKPAEAGHGGH